MNLVVLSDFDGTIVNIDTAEFILGKFAAEEWMVYDEQLKKGEITLEECMQRQFSLIRVPKARILKELENVASFRPNFERLVEYCRTRTIPFIIVSAGLDFVIMHFLKLRGLQGLVEVHAAQSRYTTNGIKLVFPRLLDNASFSFKDDLVKHYKAQGKRVVFIGDGFSDSYAARKADLSFAIKGSELALLCKREGVSCREISDFQEVVEAIRRL